MTHPDIASAIAQGHIRDMHATAAANRRTHLARCCTSLLRTLIRRYQTRTRQNRPNPTPVACCT